MKKNYSNKRKKNLKNFCSKNYYILKFIIPFILSFSIFSASANENLTAKNQIDNLIKDLIIYHKENINSKDRIKKLNLLKYVNLDFMAKATTGSYWKNANKKNKVKYKELLLKKIIDTIDFHTKKLNEYKYIYKKTLKRGKKLIYVKGILKNKEGEKIDITWKMYSKDLSILDLEIEKISLIKTQKSETMSLLRKNKGNFQEFIEIFNKKSIR